MVVKRKGQVGANRGQPKSVKLPPDLSDKDFEPIAKMITDDPPTWLAGHLRRWAMTIWLDQAVNRQQPSRAEMRRVLIQVEKAASLVVRALGSTPVREFLDLGGDGAMTEPGKLRHSLADVAVRAGRASASPVLVDSAGKTKAGTGRAAPPGATLPQAACALVIAETWKFFARRYPGSKNERATKAAEAYWHLIGCERRKWGNRPWAAWRPYFKQVKSPELAALRDECARHLREAAARGGPPENPTEISPEI